jgi:hypothetical protein
LSSGPCDINGTPVSKGEVAKGLGFVNVAALDWWSFISRDRTSEEIVKVLAPEVANLREQVKRMQESLAALDERTIGSQRIGCVD